MFKVRGVNMFPRQVEELLGTVEGALSEYQIVISRGEGGRDRMVLTAEAEDGVDFAQTSGVIRELFKSRIGMTPEVEVVPHGTLARSMKKTKRVIDQRYD